MDDPSLIDLPMVAKSPTAEEAQNSKNGSNSDLSSRIKRILGM